MGKEDNSRSEDWYDFIRDNARIGEVADFTQAADYDPDNKPRIDARFLRRLMIGQDDTKLSMAGLRLKGVRVEGVLDLSDCAGFGNEGLPALMLEHCDLPFLINLNGAHIARFSIEKSGFKAIWGRGLRLDGDLNFTKSYPASEVQGGDGSAYIRVNAAQIGGGLRGRGAKLIAPDEFPEVFEDATHVLGLQSSRIRGNVLLDQGFSAKGRLWLYGTKIGGSLSFGGAKLINDQDYALVAAIAEIGGAVQLRAAGKQKLVVEGDLSFNGATIGRDLEISKASVKGRLLFQGARIDGQLYAFDNNINNNIVLTGSRIGRLADTPETAWGTNCQLFLDEIDLTHLGANGRPGQFWKARAKWLKRASRTESIWKGQNKNGRGKRRVVLDPGKFNNQPWRQVAAAFDRAGLHRDARRIRREEQREANRFRTKWQKPFIWLFAEQLFGFGLSVNRSIFTVLGFWFVGTIGAFAMLSTDRLVESDMRGGVTRVVCDSVQAPLYALDAMVPLLDLGQDRECEPGEAEDASRPPFKGKRLDLGRFGIWNFPTEVGLWRWFHALYAIFGSFIVGFAVLTWTGVFKPRAD